ncbi:MAG: ATP-binding protein [Chloroflexi bacterium]|nr:ATP-binding protein [Chloroflexota bacterium]
MANRPDDAPPNGRRQDAARAHHESPGRFGLRMRLGVIVLAGALPLLAANVAWLALDASDARAEAMAETSRLAEAVTSAFEQALDGTRTALVAIAAEEELKVLDAERCSEQLAVLLAQFPEYSNLSAADRDGLIFCSAAPTTGVVTVDDRDWFQRAIEGQGFVVGGYQVGRIVGRPLIIGAVPIRGASGEIVGTVQASITLDSLAAIASDVDLPSGAALTVLDHAGAVLVRLPGGDGYVGQRPPESELVDAVLAAPPAGRDHHGEPRALTGLDGVERLYAIDGVTSGDDALHVAVGFSVDQAYAGAARRFAVVVGVLVAALLLALGLVVTVSRRLVLGPVAALGSAANRIAGGDLGARTGLGGTDELGRLADAFDRMADSVQLRVEARTSELNDANEELREAERRVHEYLDIAVDPLVVARAVRGATGTIEDFENTFANEPALDIVGAVAKVGTRLSDLPPELSQARLRMWADVVESGRPQEYEAAFRHAGTGDELDLLVRVTKVGDGVAVAFRDISAAKRLQRALESARAEAERAREAAESARAEAERANLSKTEFLSRMSHELRTPLNSVIGFAQILELDGLEGDQAESVDHILRSGRHLLTLINEVLDISRIESGTLSTSPEPVAIGDAVHEAVELIRPLVRDRGLTVEVRMSDGRPGHVLADRQHLRQILLNLLSNAVKFNRPAGTIEVGVEPTDGERCRISIRDEGPGIPAAMRDRVFTPFDRLGAEGGRVEGTGLGLSLSRALAERMDGTLDFVSTTGHGSTFWLELPIATSPPSGAIAPNTSVAPSGTGGTVLYIDDNVSNLELVSRILERRGGGVQVVPAMLGGLGLELARERPDLILLDLHLPDMNGEEVLARLLADPVTRDIPVLVMSADASPGVVERLMASGASAFVTKPLVVSEFMALLDRHLARRPLPPKENER